MSCDVLSDKNIKKLFLRLKKIWKNFDGIVHSIAYCPKEQFQGDFIHNINRKAFNISHEISSYSFIALIKECRNMLNENSSLLTLSYLGANRVMTNYNVMGLAKSSLESSVRYMASALGEKNIRVNAISSGIIKTASSYKIKNFHKIKKKYYESALIKSHITSEHIGNVSTFLLSDLSIGITGSVIYVDNGFNVSNAHNV